MVVTQLDDLNNNKITNEVYSAGKSRISKRVMHSNRRDTRYKLFYLVRLLFA
jgi:hypothetical protein